MTNDVRRVHQRSMESFQAACADEVAMYQRAMLAGDVDEASRCAGNIAGLRVTMRELDALANEALNPQPQRSAVPVDKYGLTDQEIEVARSSFTAPDMTDDQKRQLYAANRAKYRHMVATGAYSIDQGTLKR